MNTWIACACRPRSPASCAHCAIRQRRADRRRRLHRRCALWRRSSSRPAGFDVRVPHRPRHAGNLRATCGGTHLRARLPSACAARATTRRIPCAGQVAMTWVHRMQSGAETCRTSRRGCSRCWVSRVPTGWMAGRDVVDATATLAPMRERSVAQPVIQSRWVAAFAGMTACGESLGRRLRGDDGMRRVAGSPPLRG